MKRLIALISAIIIGSFAFILLICEAEKTGVLIATKVGGFVLLYVVHLICKHFKLGQNQALQNLCSDENNNA